MRDDAEDKKGGEEEGDDDDFENVSLKRGRRGRERGRIINMSDAGGGGGEVMDDVEEKSMTMTSKTKRRKVRGGVGRKN